MPSGSVEILEVLGEAPAASEPGEAALDNPSFRQDSETADGVRALHDFNRQIWHRPGGGLCEDGALVTTICEQLCQEREASKQRIQHKAPAIAVLNISGMHDRMQHQAQRVDQYVSLLTLDLLARVVTRRVNRRAPFSALFTLWLSITHAVGLTSRSACSRHAT